MKALGYALQEALISLRRGGRSATLSIGTIAVAFLTLGAFLLISSNLRSIVERWTTAAEMSVYLADDLDEGARQQLIAELSSREVVAGVEYVSKDAALARFKSDFPELGDLAGAGNPLPATLEVRLRSGVDGQAAAQTLVSDLEKRTGVTDVRYDRQWLARLLGVAEAIRITGFAVAAVLVLGAAFTVAAVVRLSLLARSDELEIMQLVGAPYTYIRGPFVAEGTLLGGIGAALSLVVLWGVFRSVQPQLIEAVAAWANAGAVQFLGTRELAALVGAGLLVGGLAGVAASRVVR